MDPTLVNKHGYTVLHEAAKSGSPGIVLMLLDKLRLGQLASKLDPIHMSFISCNCSELRYPIHSTPDNPQGASLNGIRHAPYPVLDGAATDCWSINIALSCRFVGYGMGCAADK